VDEKRKGRKRDGWRRGVKRKREEEEMRREEGKRKIDRAHSTAKWNQ